MKRRSLLHRLAVAALGGGLLVVPAMVNLQTAHASTASYNVIDDTAGHVTADALPTVQIDSGVVWSTAIAGDMVFAGGQFSNARPAGAAAGTNLTARSNILAFSLSTGQLNTTFAPSVNGTVRVLALSPDKSVLYIGGSFTQVNGQARSNIAAVSTATGDLLPFAPSANNVVDAITVSDSTVYFGGGFTAVNGQSRPYLAAATTAGALTTWAPSADYVVRGLALTPDGSRVIAGGSFEHINGTMSPSLASIDAINGTLYPFAANQTIQNYGTSSGVWSLHSDGTSILATGYWFGGVGDFEGIARLDPYSGAITWMADCHGDSYDSASMNGVVYAVSHHHDCSNINTQPQQNVWQHQMADSWTYDATTTVGPNTAGGYHDFSGQPAPSEYAWFPTLAPGTASGQSQAAWTVSASNGYVVLGGEFPTVNDRAQYGLTRFTTPAKAPNKQGPVLNAAAMTPTLTPVGDVVKVNWPSSWDRDNQQLTYTLYRNDLGSKPLYTVTTTSQRWNLPLLGYLDTGLKTNATYTYHVVVNDASGNKVVGSSASVTTGTASLSSSRYSQAVTDDGAAHYWRFTEPTGSGDVIDWAGKDDLTIGSGVGLGANGFMSGSDDTAATFDGTDNGRAVDTASEAGSNTLSIETWIRTSSTQGGKIIGFGDSSSLSTSSNYDRQIYMDNAGHLVWGTNGGWTHMVTSPNTYNDNQWHQVVATLSSAGTTLYVDGIKVGGDTTETTAQTFTGYWHIGGDNLNGWANQPSSNDFQGTIDDTSVYPTALTTGQIRNHYVLSGRSVDLPQRPGDAYGGLVYDDNPDLYWRMDETLGTTAHDATQNLDNGTYTGGYTQAQDSSVEGTSVLFNGQDSGVYENSGETSPNTYSEEAWFNTTSTAGGKIIGFGSNQSGNSSSYDRHVYMDAQGHVNFGVWSGQENVITSDQSYNDGNWHHVVATQGSDGMHLYLDGVSVGSNPTTTGQDYTGYWRVGGDSTWSGANYFNGLIDEAAVYDRALPIDDVRAHYRASTRTTNRAPVPSFTVACDDFGGCSANAQASSDADGTVAAYEWSIDGVAQTSTDPELSSSLTAGRHTITLTVTDDQGESASTSRTVDVTVANRPPVAAFTPDCDATSCSFDASVSSDVDGTITSYAWDFGDGSTGSGAAPTHAYAQPGTYTVKLTVTDDQGASASGQKTITVTQAVPPTASFTATTNDLTASVDASASSTTGATMKSYAWDFGDGTRDTGVTASHTYDKAGTYTITLTTTDSHGLTDTTTNTVTPTAANVAPTASFTAQTNGLELDADATASTDSDGSVKSYAWDFGDGSTGTGMTPSHTYASTGTYTVTLTVTDDQGATDTFTRSVGVKAANLPPTASFTSQATGLSLAVDASASQDADGTIASYAWDFGDGSTGTGATATHTFTQAGTYTVLLTVSDDAGATTTVSKQVDVSVPVATPATLASDSYARTGTGWGSATQGGTYTYTTPAAFSTSAGQGLIKLTKGGSGPTATLPVTATDFVWSGAISIDKLDNGTGVYASLLLRHTTASDYRAKVHVLPTGAASLTLSKMVNGTETVLGTSQLGTYAPGSQLNMSVRVTGSSSVAIQASVWTGATAPAKPSLSVTDSKSPLTGGSLVFMGYLSSTSTNAPITVAFQPWTLTAA